MTLLLFVKRIFELSEELPGDVALESALDVSVALLLRSAAVGVGLGGGIVTEPVHGHDVQGPVELTPEHAPPNDVPRVSPIAGSAAVDLRADLRDGL